MAAKTKKIEKNEEFIRLWEQEVSLWDVFDEKYKDRNEKKKAIENLAAALGMTGKLLKNYSLVA